MTASSLTALESIECFVCISNERKTHFSLLFIWHGTCLSTVDSAGVFLRNLVDGEVRHIDVRAESGFEWCPDVTKMVPNHAAEEWVVFDLVCTSKVATLFANAMFRVAQEAV